MKVLPKEIFLTDMKVEKLNVCHSIIFWKKLDGFHLNLLRSRRFFYFIDLLPKYKLRNNKKHTVGKEIVEKNYKIQLGKQITSKC